MAKAIVTWANGTTEEFPNMGTVTPQGSWLMLDRTSASYGSKVWVSSNNVRSVELK